jgi:hypothetical protein
MPGPTRQDTYNVSVTVFRPDNNKVAIIKGTWDKLTGGEVDSDDTKYYPGGMVDPISLGGRKSVGNLTVSRLYRLERDHDAAQAMINAVGKSKVTISKQPLDLDGNSSGRPIVYNGILKRCTFPEVDSEASGAGMIELEVTVDGFPTS